MEGRKVGRRQGGNVRIFFPSSFLFPEREKSLRWPPMPPHLFFFFFAPQTLFLRRFGGKKRLATSGGESRSNEKGIRLFLPARRKVSLEKLLAAGVGLEEEKGRGRGRKKSIGQRGWMGERGGGGRGKFCYYTEGEKEKKFKTCK